MFNNSRCQVWYNTNSSVGISGLRDRSVHTFYIMASNWHAVDALLVNTNDLKLNCANIQAGVSQSKNTLNVDNWKRMRQLKV